MKKSCVGARLIIQTHLVCYVRRRVNQRRARLGVDVASAQMPNQSAKGFLDECVFPQINHGTKSDATGTYQHGRHNCEGAVLF